MISKQVSSLKEVIKEKDRKDIFELRLNHNCNIFTESIMDISFSKTNRYMYITCRSLKKENLLQYIKDEYIHEGLQLIVCNSYGHIQDNFSFEGCKLKDIAKIEYSYDILPNDIIYYIISISYEQIFKLITLLDYEKNSTSHM